MGQSLAFIYPNGKGLFASDTLVKEGERARAVISDPELARAARYIFAHLKRERHTRFELSQLAPKFNMILQSNGIRADAIYLPSNNTMTERVLLKRRH